MLLRVVILFLAAMAAIAVLGRLVSPRRRGGRVSRLPPPAACRRCGRSLAGPGPCACGEPRG